MRLVVDRKESINLETRDGTIYSPRVVELVVWVEREVVEWVVVGWVFVWVRVEVWVVGVGDVK